MDNSGIALLAISVFLAGGIVILIMVGSLSIRTGLRALPRAHHLGQEAVWHKQPNVMFGFTNFSFALLLGMVLVFLLVEDMSVKGIVAGIGMCMLILSVVLVARSIFYTLQAARNLRGKRVTRNED
ncbi:MAG TPA: hypothetical protein VFB12_19015 [Ktedonobacteraceae bacterium]|nr:hypothetical protein [Ktedonobacteraceae bacterium]